MANAGRHLKPSDNNSPLRPTRMGGAHSGGHLKESAQSAPIYQSRHSRHETEEAAAPRVRTAAPRVRPSAQKTQKAEDPRSQARAIDNVSTEQRFVLSAPFFITLMLLCLVGLIFPLRPKVSSLEKRELTKFPKLTAASFFSGDFFDGVSDWYADTFPGRDGWLKLGNRVEAMHGFSTVYVDLGDVGEADAIPVPAESRSPENSGVETPEIDPIETEDPNTEPKIGDLTGLTTPEGITTNVQGIDVANMENVAFGKVIQIDDIAYQYFGFSQYWSDRFARIMNNCANKLEAKGIKTYCMLIPSSVGVMVSTEYQEKLKCSDQGQTIDYIHSQMNDNITKVNIFNILAEHNDEYLYFYTDHHWTALGAYYAYAQFCEYAGLTPVPLDEFDEKNMGEYLGTSYSQAPRPDKLKHDNVYAYESRRDITMKIADDGYIPSAYKWPIIVNTSGRSVYDKYLCFMSGDHAVSVLVNNDNPDGKTIIVAKDSYGNAFVPFLAENYHVVYAIDWRRFKNFTVTGFVDYYNTYYDDGIDEFLLCGSLTLCADEGMTDIYSFYLT